ncbi:unnamed protein product [Auanema sp. JU1783]|nr:unnamed protein product [Auanema sp. JU1783]
MTVKKICRNQDKDTDYFRTMKKDEYFVHYGGLNLDILNLFKYDPKITAVEDDRYIDYFHPDRLKMENVMVRFGQDFHQFALPPKHFSTVNDNVFDFFLNIHNIWELPSPYVINCIMVKHGRLPNFELHNFIELEDEVLRDFMVMTVAFKYLAILQHCSESFREQVIRNREPTLSNYLYSRGIKETSAGTRFYEWFVSIMRKYTLGNIHLLLKDKLQNYKDDCYPYVVPFVGYETEEDFYRSSYPPQTSGFSFPPIHVGVHKHYWRSDLEFKILCLAYQGKKEASHYQAIKAEMQNKVSNNGTFRIFKHSNYGASCRIHLRGLLLPSTSGPAYFNKDYLLSEIQEMEYTPHLSQSDDDSFATYGYIGEVDKH